MTPEIINYHDHQHAFAGWAIVKLLASLDEKGIKTVQGTEEAERIEILVTINGYQVSFLELLNNLKREYDLQVRRDAGSLIRQKMGDLGLALDRLETQIDKMLET
jgi:hypothetical protein